MSVAFEVTTARTLPPAAEIEKVDAIASGNAIVPGNVARATAIEAATDGRPTVVEVTVEGGVVVTTTVDVVDVVVEIGAVVVVTWRGDVADRRSWGEVLGGVDGVELV